MEACLRCAELVRERDELRNDSSGHQVYYRYWQETIKERDQLKVAAEVEARAADEARAELTATRLTYYEVVEQRNTLAKEVKRLNSMDRIGGVRILERSGGCYKCEELKAEEVDKKISEMRELLAQAQSAIHSEFCGSKEWPLCQKLKTYLEAK